MREELPSAQGAAGAAPAGSNPDRVIRDELEPVLADDGSGVPHGLWQGLSVTRVEELISFVEIPPRSAVLHGLFRRLITANVSPPAGGETSSHFTALRIESLDRLGLANEAADILSREPAASTDTVLQYLSARTAIASGDKQQGCETAKAAAAAQAALPGRLKTEAILLSAYCAAASGDMTAASIKVQLARELGGDSAGLDALDIIASGGKPVLPKDKKISLIDWRILELGGEIDASALLEHASPGLLAVLAKSQNTGPSIQLMAAELTAGLNAIAPEDLAKTYLSQGAPDQSATPSPDGATNSNPVSKAAGAQRRAQLFTAANAERTPAKKARLIRSYLDDARREGLYWAALRLMAPLAAAIQRVPELGWFAETGIETALAAGDFQLARSWAQLDNGAAVPDAAGGAHSHWLALADIADPTLTASRSGHLATLESLAARGRLNSDQLHRLATVLDGLDVQVPIPLWELASRTPQPEGGHLPETGVLSELADAAKKKEFGHTVLVAMKALGPNGAEGAHMIALGDSIRALRRAGLEPDARKLALEALFAGWPRTLSN